MSTKPIILESDGVLGQLPNGGIINAGGTSNPTFTVGGRGLLFDDDGTSTGTGSSLTLQTAYNNSPAVGGQTTIKLATGKDLAIVDDTDNNIFFKVDAETGKVTITGDLEVLGSSSVINTVIQDSDHWLISPKSGTTTPLKIEPDIGVVPIVDLVTIRRTYGSAPVFRIDSSGNLIATQNLTISGTINGIDIVALNSNFNKHLSGMTGFRHLAAQVDIAPIVTLPGITNVQDALAQINYKVDNISASGGTGSRGYEHIQTAANTTWTIGHGLMSMRAQVVVYDTNWEQIIAERVKIIDANTILVTFLTPIAGRAMIVVF